MLNAVVTFVILRGRKQAWTRVALLLLDVQACRVRSAMQIYLYICISVHTHADVVHCKAGWHGIMMKIITCVLVCGTLTMQDVMLVGYGCLANASEVLCEFAFHRCARNLAEQKMKGSGFCLGLRSPILGNIITM